MGIIDIIGVGKENAVTRAELCAAMNLPDRAVRKMIAEAREQGALIICDQDGAGYYISEDPADLRRQMVTNRSRAMSILRQQKFLRQKIAEAENAEQMTLEEVSK